MRAPHPGRENDVRVNRLSLSLLRVFRQPLAVPVTVCTAPGGRF
jgi:hypothetical protein